MTDEEKGEKGMRMLIGFIVLITLLGLAVVYLS